MLFFFSKLNFQKIFHKHYQSAKRFRSRSGPDLGPNCLQRLLADGKNRLWQGKS